MNNENILYNGYIFDYSKKYIEEMDEDESFYPTILIENHSSKCRRLEAYYTIKIKLLKQENIL